MPRFYHGARTWALPMMSFLFVLLGGTKISAVTPGTNLNYISLLADTPLGSSTTGVFGTFTNANFAFSNRVSMAGGGSAEAFLTYTSAVEIVEGELRSIRIVANGGGSAVGPALSDREDGAIADAAVFYSIPFFSTNETTVTFKTFGDVRAYSWVVPVATGHILVDQAPFNPDLFLEHFYGRTNASTNSSLVLSNSFMDQLIIITNEVRTQRVVFPPGQYHRLWINFIEGAFVDSRYDVPDQPGGSSTIEVEITFDTSTNQVRWVNSNGGSYFVADNWDPARVPEKSDSQADVALFDLPMQYTVDSTSLSAAAFGASAAPVATAERWVLQGGEVRNIGGATLEGMDPLLPSLSIGKNSRLNLQSGTLQSVHTRLGDSPPGMSEIWIMGEQSKWTNSGYLYVGEYTPAQILAFDGQLETEEVRLGMGAPGEAYLRGRLAKWKAGNIAVGYMNATGKLSVEDGAYMETDGLYLGYEEGSRGELVISGRSSERGSALWSLGTNEIGRLGPAEMKVLDGGSFLHTKSVNLSTFQASVTGNRPAKLISQGVHASGEPAYILGGGEVFIGGGGSLEAHEGGLVEFVSGWIGLTGGGNIRASGVHTPTRQRSLIYFYEGLVLGWFADAYSNMSITNGAKIQVDGDTQLGALSEYFVAIHTEKDGFSAELEITDPVAEFNAGQVVVFPGGLLRTKAVVLSGNDDYEAQVFVNSGPDFPGWIALGDIRIGTEGRAELAIFNGAIVSCTGNVITYPGKGRIIGEGTIRTLTLTNSGNFSPGTSPGTITIEGDFVQTETGKLQIEIAGTEEGRFDTLKITGKADIGGTIEYVFNDFFIPKEGDKFNAIYVAGAATKTGQEIFPSKPLGVESIETSVTDGVVEVTRVVSTNFNVMQQFGSASEGATNGWGQLTLATDGLIYGCLRNGGQFDGGAIFSVRPEGYDFKILRHLNPIDDGAQPLGGVTQARNGKLFGTCSIGGSLGVGTLWQMEIGGKEFRVLRHFGNADDLENPSAELIERSDGILLGTAQNGGFDDRGGVFRVNPETGVASVVTGFQVEQSGSPRGPLGGLVEGENGIVYGTSERGGNADNGAVFALTRNGAVETIASLGVVPGGARFPQCTLLLDEDGTLYGTTFRGGRSNFGTIFAVRTNGTDFRILKNMGVTAVEGREPLVGLVEAPDGTLLGTTRIGGSANQGTVFRIRKDGTEYANIRSFGLADSGGARSRSPLLQAAGGVFYGTTFGGGVDDQGVLFRIFTPGLITAPEIREPPRSIVGAPGSTLTLTAEVNGPKPLRYQWQHQGTNIPGAFSPTLTIPQADASRLGAYRLRVTGLGGEVESDPVQAGFFSMLPDRTLLLQGIPGTQYRIETTDEISADTVWIEMTNVLLSEVSATVPTGNARVGYFRAVLLGTTVTAPLTTE